MRKLLSLAVIAGLALAFTSQAHSTPQPVPNFNAAQWCQDHGVSPQNQGQCVSAVKAFFHEDNAAPNRGDIPRLCKVLRAFLAHYPFIPDFNQGQCVSTIMHYFNEF